MTTTLLETSELIDATLPTEAKAPREASPKRKPAGSAAANLARARTTIEKLEEQNDKAAGALAALGALWLSADAKRRQGEAEIALNHFNEALAALRKSMAAS